MTDSILYFPDHIICDDHQTAEIIQKAVPKIKVVQIKCDIFNIEQSVNEFQDYKSKMLENEYISGLIGTGFGGFVANYIANKFIEESIQINPITDPIEFIRTNHLNCPFQIDALKKYYLNDVNGLGKIAVLGKKDEIISFEKAYNKFKGRYAIYVKEKMKHLIEGVTDISDGLNTLLNYVVI